MSDPFFNYFKRERTKPPGQLFSGRISGAKKTYDYAPTVAVEPAKDGSHDQLLADSLLIRSSDFLPQTLSALLGQNALSKAVRHTESVLELYIFANSVADLATGVYHYQPKQHVLEQLLVLTPDEITGAVSIMAESSLKRPPAALVCLTLQKSCLDASQGALAYKHALIEAGKIIQLIANETQPRGLSTQVLIDGDEAVFYELADLDSSIEPFVVGMAIDIPD